MKLSRLSFFAFLVLGLCLTSCSKEKQMTKNIEGEWDITSLQLNGQETMGITVESMTIDFGNYSNDEGTVVITMKEMGRDFDSDTGTYSISAGQLDNGGSSEEGIVSIIIDDETIIFNSTISKKELQLIGTNSDGDKYDISGIK